MQTKSKDISGINFLEGTMLLVNKPLTWTSFDVVNKVRYNLKKRLNIKKIKVGHAGTLDPLATGLLILCTGKFTKKLDSYQGMFKEYTGTITLGGTTPSHDLEMEVDQEYPTDHITKELIEQARLSFLGDIEQLPPMFSALKVNGEPLYKRARKGEKVEVKARPVHIYDFEVDSTNFPNIDFRVCCSKGTYIRSLAYDFGKALNSGAHLTKLVRNKIGEYNYEDAWDLDELIEVLQNTPTD